jgi:hypothetical protein
MASSRGVFDRKRFERFPLGRVSNDTDRALQELSRAFHSRRSPAERDKALGVLLVTINGIAAGMKSTG